jgi:hypothetical protein
MCNSSIIPSLVVDNYISIVGSRLSDILYNMSPLVNMVFFNLYKISFVPYFLIFNPVDQLYSTVTNSSTNE